MKTVQNLKQFETKWKKLSEFALDIGDFRFIFACDVDGEWG